MKKFFGVKGRKIHVTKITHTGVVRHLISFKAGRTSNLSNLSIDRLQVFSDRGTNIRGILHCLHRYARIHDIQENETELSTRCQRVVPSVLLCPVLCFSDTMGRVLVERRGTPIEISRTSIYTRTLVILYIVHSKMILNLQ